MTKKKVVKRKVWVLLSENGRRIVTIEKAYGKKRPEYYNVGTWSFYTKSTDKWILADVTYTPQP